MHDPRIEQLADLLLDHSCDLQQSEIILIEVFDLPEANLVCALVEGAAHRQAVPLVSTKNNTILRSLYRTATAECMQLAARFEQERMKGVDAYIGKGSTSVGRLQQMQGKQR